MEGTRGEPCLSGREHPAIPGQWQQGEAVWGQGHHRGCCPAAALELLAGRAPTASAEPGTARVTGKYCCTAPAAGTGSGAPAVQARGHVPEVLREEGAHLSPLSPRNPLIPLSLLILLRPLIPLSPLTGLPTPPWPMPRPAEQGRQNVTAGLFPLEGKKMPLIFGQPSSFRSSLPVPGVGILWFNCFVSWSTF